MAKTCSLYRTFALVFLAVSILGSFAAEVHHVVGDDRGWDQSTDVEAWSADKIFRAGDSIWFAYSAALESVAELSSKEEFEACDLTNPLRLYTGGLDRVSLDGQGHRFFISNSPQGCKNGLKLHVNVLPLQAEDGVKNPATTRPASENPAIVATGPTPSNTFCLRGVSPPMWLGFALLHLLFSKVLAWL